MTAVSTTSPPDLSPSSQLEIDDLRDLMRSVSQTTQRLEATHTALQNQVARLQSELAEANAQLQRSRSLAALGEMAAGIAHEVRNPLGSIQLYVQVLAEELRASPEQAKICTKIDRAVVGLDAIVRDVLTFARSMKISPRRTNAGELFDRALAGCEALVAGAGIEVKREVADDCEVKADSVLMTQALGNVIRNAIEAIEQSGGAAPLREAAADRRLALEAQRAVVRCPDGKRAMRVVLAVEDSGPGIPAEVVERMFNPFFTTRKAGTGLGLAIVHRIVDAHGGHINVKPAKPRGARIEICIPEEESTPRATEVESDEV